MSSPLFDEVNPKKVALVALVVAIPICIIVASMITSKVKTETCDITAAKFAADNDNSQANNPADARRFAGRYQAFRAACPNGHMLVDESKLPEAVKFSIPPAKN